MNRQIRTIASPVGKLTLVQEGEALTGLFFDSREPGQAETPLLLRAEQELNEYFQGSRREFDLPLAPKGTEFQRRVWQALCTIPYGETRSYQDLAILSGCPKGYRAVGMANNRNPISILIPCHRVIGKNGSLTGYGGGLETKAFLLKLESGRQ